MLKALSHTLVMICFICIVLSRGASQTSTANVVVQTEAGDNQGNENKLPASSDGTVSASPESVPIPHKSTGKTLAHKNDYFDFEKRPRLIVYPQLDLNNGGFAPISETITGGAGIELEHYIIESTASYDNAHKDNDGTVDNHKGRIRGLGSEAFYRFPNYWFVGTSGGWYQLSTTNYSTQTWTMQFGGGSDFIFRDAGFRFIAAYTPPYFDHRNGSQGFNVEFDDPSPLVHSHVMFVASSSAGWFHTTITDPADPLLTAQQKASKHISGGAQYGLLFRF
jgi:hypothetical protein